MIRSLLRSVIHGAHVTHGGGAGLQVDPLILRAAEILPMEEVEFVHCATGERPRTWAEPSAEESGEIHLGTARQGDTVPILCFGLLHDGQTPDHKARVVRLDARNRVVSVP